MNTLPQWLDDPNRSFKEGLMHYIMSGHGNARLISSMSSTQDDPDSYHTQKLHYELEIILENYPDAYLVAPEVPIVIPPAPIVNKIAPNANILASQGNIDTSDAINWHKEHGFTHEAMRNATSDADRLTHAKRIMKVIIPTLDAIYQGDPIPDDPDNAPPKAEMSEAETLKAVNLIVSRISKARAKLKAGNKAMNPIIDDLIEQRDALKLKLSTWQKV